MASDRWTWSTCRTPDIPDEGNKNDTPGQHGNPHHQLQAIDIYGQYTEPLISFIKKKNDDIPGQQPYTLPIMVDVVTIYDHLCN